MTATAGGMIGSFTMDGDRRSAMPVFGLAIGPPSFFAETRVADYEPAGVPGPVFQLGIGARVAGTGSLVRGGVSELGVYGSALFVTPGDGRSNRGSRTRTRKPTRAVSEFGNGSP